MLFFYTVKPDLLKIKLFPAHSNKIKSGNKAVAVFIRLNYLDFFFCEPLAP